MSEIVKIENRQGPVVTVCLNRPDKKNAWTFEMFDALSAAAKQLSAENSLRAVILQGAGGCFLAGLDFSVFSEFATRLDDLKSDMLNPPAGQKANRFQQPVVAWQELGVPVIAAIDGVCFGAGMQLALAADFRIAAPNARFSIMEGKWGLIPDMGISQSLPGLLRPDQAKDLMMTARIVEAAEALDLGLISRIEIDSFGAAQDMAGVLAQRSPDAVRAAKQLINNCWGSAPDGLAMEAQLQAELIGASNQLEAVFANVENRAPKFS